MDKKVDLSAIIVYYQNYEYDEIEPLFKLYKENLDKVSNNNEFIFVIDGNMPKVLDTVYNLAQENHNIKIVKLGRWFGDATSLQAGFEAAEGNIIITLPSFQQVEAEEIPKMIEALKDNDMVIGWRYPRVDSFLNNFQSKAFNRIVRSFVDTNFHDLKCNVRVLKKEVLENIYMYGDQDRFLPLWAWRLGYKIKEIKVKQHKADFRQTLYPFSSYLQRTLELISLFFLIKFTKKPIRFFGSWGLIIFSLGAILGIVLFIQRMFFEVSLADRPIVLVSLLLAIFGILAFAIGLVGELIIFTHAKDVKDYIVEKVYQYGKENDSFATVENNENK